MHTVPRQRSASQDPDIQSRVSLLPPSLCRDSRAQSGSLWSPEPDPASTAACTRLWGWGRPCLQWGGPIIPSLPLHNVWVNKLTFRAWCNGHKGGTEGLRSELQQLPSASPNRAGSCAHPFHASSRCYTLSSPLAAFRQQWSRAVGRASLAAIRALPPPHRQPQLHTAVLQQQPSCSTRKRFSLAAVLAKFCLWPSQTSAGRIYGRSTD